MADDPFHVVLGNPAAGLEEGGGNSSIIAYQYLFCLLHFGKSIVSRQAFGFIHQLVVIRVGIVAVVVGTVALKQLQKALGIVVVGSPTLFRDGPQSPVL